MSETATQFAQRVENERETWRQYQRNRRETTVNCSQCGGRANKTTIHGQTSIACENKSCLHYEVIDEKQEHSLSELNSLFE